MIEQLLRDEAGPVTVLVVEDEPLIRMDVVDLLEEAGFVVFEAGNAKDALTVLGKNAAIRVMFTDVDMPGGMDGLELAAVVRVRWPNLKILVTSGYRAINPHEIPGGGPFFAKPYDAGALIETVRAITR